MKNEKCSSSSIGLGGFIFLVFLVLKLANIGTVATWSWLWITSPLWIPLAVIVGMVVVVTVVKITQKLIKEI